MIKKALHLILTKENNTMKNLLLTMLFALALCSCKKEEDWKPTVSPAIHETYYYTEAQTGTASPLSFIVWKRGQYDGITITYELISGSGTLRTTGGQTILSKDSFRQEGTHYGKHDFTFTPENNGENILRFTTTDNLGSITTDIIITSVPTITVSVATPSILYTPIRGGTFEVNFNGQPTEEFSMKLNSSNAYISTAVLNNLNELITLTLEPGQTYRFQSDVYPFQFIGEDWTKDIDLDFTITDPQGASKNYTFQIVANKQVY